MECCPTCGQVLPNDENPDGRGFIINHVNRVVSRGDVVIGYGPLRFKLFMFYYERFERMVHDDAAKSYVWGHDYHTRSLIHVTFHHMRSSLRDLGLEIVSPVPSVRMMRFIKSQENQ